MWFLAAASNEEVERVARRVSERMDVAIERLNPVVDQLTQEIMTRGIVMGIAWFVILGLVSAVCWYMLWLVYKAMNAGVFADKERPYSLMAILFASGAVSTGFGIWNAMAYLYEVCSPGLTLFDHLMKTCR